jgi:hypothetical protein
MILVIYLFSTYLTGRNDTGLRCLSQCYIYFIKPPHEPTNIILAEEELSLMYSLYENCVPCVQCIARYNRYP